MTTVGAKKLCSMTTLKACYLLRKKEKHVHKTLLRMLVKREPKLAGVHNQASTEPEGEEQIS